MSYIPPSHGSMPEWMRMVAHAANPVLSGSVSYNLATGNAYKINSVQVVGARIAGWTAPTGTASRGGFATYTAPDITDPPTEAEVQAIADHLEELSQSLKAALDDLTTHGLIGA